MHARSHAKAACTGSMHARWERMQHQSAMVLLLPQRCFEVRARTACSACKKQRLRCVSSLCCCAANIAMRGRWGWPGLPLVWGISGSMLGACRGCEPRCTALPADVRCGPTKPYGAGAGGRSPALQGAAHHSRHKDREAAATMHTHRLPTCEDLSVSTGASWRCRAAPSHPLQLNSIWMLQLTAHH